MSDKIGNVLRINTESIKTQLLAHAPERAPDAIPTYRRHTLFQRAHRELNPNTPATFGNEVSFRIPYDGDLVSRMWLAVTLPSVSAYVDAAITEAGDAADFVGPYWGYRNHLAYCLIDEVAVYLNGVLYDRQTGASMLFDTQLEEKSEGHEAGLDSMVGRVRDAGGVDPASDLRGAQSLQIPLRFWFNKTHRQALPLVAIGEEEVEVRVRFAPLANIVFQKHTSSSPTVNGIATPFTFIGSPFYGADDGGDVTITGLTASSATATLLSATGPVTTDDFQPTAATLWCEYFYLGQEEQAMFIKNTMDQPVQQVNRIPPVYTDSTATQRFPLNTKNPIVRVYIALEEVAVTQPTEAGGNLSEPFAQCQLSSGLLPSTFGIGGDGSARLMLADMLPITEVSLLYDTSIRLTQGRERLHFIEAADRNGYLWQLPGVGLLSWQEDLRQAGPSGSATMNTLSPELVVRLSTTARSRNWVVRAYVVSQNVMRVQTGGAALLFEQNG